MTADPQPRLHRASAQPPDGRKTALRAEFRAARAALPPSRREAAEQALCAHLEGLPELGGGGPYLLYAAAGGEARVDALAGVLLRRGARICLPRVDGSALALHEIHDPAQWAALAPGWRGVREPDPGSLRVEFGDVAAAVVPGVGFDRHGNRLGSGGGHYDRLLAGLRTVLIGAAFDVQVVDDLPVEPHDRPVDIVVTESGAARAR